MGDVVLGELLRALGKTPPAQPRADVYVILIGNEMLGASQQVLRRLRDHGVRAESPYSALRVGKAKKAADQVGVGRAG